MRGKMKMSDAETESYRRLQKNDELLAFHLKSGSDAGFSDDEVEYAGQTLRDCFGKIEEALKHQQWIVGDRFSLADITWVPVHFTLVTSDFSFEDYPRVTAWVQAIRARPSFQKGVLEWSPKKL